VVELVRKYGPKRWTLIAKHLKGRIGKQCRERWHNHLNPEIKKTSWTDEEDRIIYSAHKQWGNQVLKSFKKNNFRRFICEIYKFFGKTGFYMKVI
jgi:myb proto-oncogene protein